MNLKQKLILKRLLAINGQKYSELLKCFSPDDKFAYHLKHLLSKGLINKRQGQYYLSKEGMSLTASFDTRTLEEIKTPHLLFLYICRHKEKFLLREHFAQDENRQKLFALPFAKPLSGQPLKESAEEEFLRKYGFEANFKYRLTYHLTTRTHQGDLLFDDLYLVFEAGVKKLPDKMLYQQKKHCWLTKEEMSSLSIHPYVKRLIIKDDRKPFIEEAIILNYGLRQEDLVE
jgi:hypothetical protein